jgi:bifunctional non-homologous end joining protein LigD
MGRVARKSSSTNGAKAALPVKAASRPGRKPAHKKPAAKIVRARGTPVMGQPRGVRAALPEFVPPQLASLVEAAPAGDEWLHEIKLDGYRMIARLAAGKATFFSRNRQDWTARFGTLAAALRKLPVASALLDGEVVVLLSDGTTNFQSLQNVLSEGRTGELVYFVFDVLHLNGRDLLGLPLTERKAILSQLVTETKRGPLRYVEHVAGRGPEFFHTACESGLEGIISKRSDGPYRPGRREDWVKTKCQQRDEFVIVGYTDPSGARSGFGSLLLGYHDDAGALVYAGRVGTGFSEKSLLELTAQLRRLAQKRSPLDVSSSEAGRRGVHWVEPRLVAQVQYSNWTNDGLLRHPSFQGLREDKPAAQVLRDVPAPPRRAAAARNVGAAAAAKRQPKTVAKARARHSGAARPNSKKSPA